MSKLKNKYKSHEQLLEEIDLLNGKIAELEEKNAIFQMIAENTSDNIGITTFDLKAKYIYVSPSVKTVLDYDPEDLIGKSFFDFIHPGDRKVLIPLLKTYVNQKIKKLFTGEELPTYNTIEFRFKNKAGNWHFMQSTVNIIGNKLLAISRDITENKQAEIALHESEEKYKNLYTSANDAIFLIHNYTFTACNPKTLEMYACIEDEIIGYSPIDFSPEYQPDGKPSSEKALEKMNAALDGKPQFFEWVHQRKDGSPFDAEVSLNKITISDNEYIQAIVRDITHRKKAEKEIQNYTQQLQERNADLNSFSHTVAHDLKNPLGTIMSFADLILNDYSNLSKNETLKYLNFIIKDCKKTQQIINSLLLFASIRKEEIKTHELNMGDIVDETLNRLSSVIKKSNAEITLPNIWPVTIGYAPWVEEVWVNYLSNSIKYGGNPPLIEIGADTGNTENIPSGMMRFWIKDNGQGISPDNQKLLFKKFERFNQVKTQGYGLGLSIVNRIIEKLGGQVGIESELEKGSLFYFTLPLSPNQKQPIKNEVTKPKHGHQIQNLKILIAEDEKTADDYLSIILKSIGKEILHAKTGIKAVEIYRNNPDIDLILMDIKMPEMNGYDATRQIRKLNNEVAIIAQTAYALKGDREKAIDAGCNDYINKPIDKEKLMEMIINNI